MIDYGDEAGEGTVADDRAVLRMQALAQRDIPALQEKVSALEAAADEAAEKAEAAVADDTDAQYAHSVRCPRMLFQDPQPSRGALRSVCAVSQCLSAALACKESCCQAPTISESSELQLPLARSVTLGTHAEAALCLLRCDAAVMHSECSSAPGRGCSPAACLGGGQGGHAHVVHAEQNHYFAVCSCDHAGGAEAGERGGVAGGPPCRRAGRGAARGPAAGRAGAAAAAAAALPRNLPHSWACAPNLLFSARASVNAQRSWAFLGPSRNELLCPAHRVHVYKNKWSKQMGPEDASGWNKTPRPSKCPMRGASPG